MKKFSPTLLACAITLVSSTSALAHHSAAAFDTQTETTITGTVTEYSFRNPHVYMSLSRTLEDGTTVITEVEAGAGSVIGPLGFDRDAIKVGDEVNILGNPSKRNPATMFLGRELYTAAGTYLPLNISSKSSYVESAETATTIAGTWFSPRTSFFGFLGTARDWKLTEAGTAAVAAASANPVPTPQKDCIPIGEPGVMFYPVANVINVQADTVVMHIDWLDSIRTIYLDGRAHPAATETSLHGHSTGHWEGTTLVVDTTNFAVNPIGLSTSLPNSTSKHLVENFALSADGKGMVYSGVMEDAQYLAAPVEWTGTWLYRPEMQPSNETCDLITAQKFLDD